MSNPIKLFIVLIFLSLLSDLRGQSSNEAKSKGQFSGNLILNYQKYIRDDKIGANTRVYKENTASTDAWLFMQYRINDYNFIVRYDGFNNSPLLDPLDAYTDHGIGFWQISKQLEKLNITVGSFYDQFGSGILFRAYEQRQIGIDYSIQGIRINYQLTDNWRIKGFSGNQKGNMSSGTRFEYSPQVLSGLNIDGEINLPKLKLNENKSIDLGNLSIGASAINRNLDRQTMEELVSIINTYDREDQFYPKYNVYGFNYYLNYNLGNFAINVESNYKTKEAIVNANNNLELKSGKVHLASISWGKSKIKLGNKLPLISVGLNVQGRYVDHFPLRTSPRENLLDGLISYLPSMTKQNTYRLMARYNAPAQDLGEEGVQGELDLKIGNKTRITFNASFVQSLEHNGDFDSILNKNVKTKLFQEYNGEITRSFSNGDKVKLGLQTIYYNQARYEQEPEYDLVYTLTPFMEWLHKIGKGKSLRIEAQYLKTDRDQGSFANLMIEYYFNKNFSFSLGDMVNIEPHRYERMTIANSVLHYPTVFMSYNNGGSFYTLSFLKQQQGVNCSGGICREEPAFSGVRFTISSNF